MKRRDFLKTSLATALGTSLPASSLLALDPQQEFYELRAYRVPDTASQELVLRYLEEGLVPALGRFGLDRVGSFTVVPKPVKSPDEPSAVGPDLTLFMILPFPTIEAFLSLRPTLEADQEYLRAAATHYARPRKEPAYRRVESWFMKAFTGMPVMELPIESREKKPRIFEVRVYESHTDEMARRKIEMFNEGEIDIMRAVGLAPLLFGETLIGNNIPNLTYILSAPDMATHEAHWKAFGTHPEWNRMKKMERYKGTISGIENYFLRPTAFSMV